MSRLLHARKARKALRRSSSATVATLFCAFAAHLAFAQESQALLLTSASLRGLLQDRGASANTTAIRPSILLIGDGLTESSFHPRNNGFGSLLTSNYTRKADVLNRGFGGYYTPWMVKYMLDDLFAAHNPKMAIIFLGLKDSMTKDVTGDHYIPPEQFGANIRAIMAKGKAAGVDHFLLITPPPVCEVCRARSPRPWDRYNNHTELYVNQLASLANEYNGALIDIFHDWAKIPVWNERYLLPDNLHLNEAGNSALHKAILNTLTESIPDMHPRKLPMVFPGMYDIDIEHPEGAFEPLMSATEAEGREERGAVVGTGEGTANGSGTLEDQGQAGRAKSSSSGRWVPVMTLTGAAAAAVLLLLW